MAALLALLAASPALLSAPALSSQEGDLRAIVAAQVDAARTAPMNDLWRRAATLRDTAKELSAEGLDSEVEKALDDPDLGERAALMLVAVRLQGGDPSGIKDQLAQRLDTLLGSSDEEIATAAATLSADPTFRTLSSEARKDFVARLHTISADATRSPALRLEAAFAAGKVGMGDDVRKARSLMQEFLQSGEADLRALGALTLARSGAEISGRLYEELRNLSILPDARGQLAASYLEKERVRELGERKLKNLGEFQAVEKGAAGSDATGSSGTAGRGAPALQGKEKETFGELASLIQMIKHLHPDGAEVTDEQLREAAMQGMLQSMDEHSSYLSPKVYSRFEQDLAAGYGGIGAYVGNDPNDSLFTITRPIYSGPAYKKGLRSEDKIVRIDDWPTIGKNQDEIIKRLKGRPGTDVKLYVWRRGMDPSRIDRPTEDMAVVVTRESITIPAEQHQMLPGGIGMVVLDSFSQVGSKELRRPLIDLMDHGMKALVLDLRYNSGGLLDEAVAVSSLFLPKGTLVVRTESPRNGEEKLYTEESPVIPPDMPMVVLVNRFTASAAEIVSGALRDHGRAVLIGERSFGKGSVQNLAPLPNYPDDQYVDENHNRRWDNWEKILKDYNGNGEFDFGPRVKLTIARYYLPLSGSIHREHDKDGNIINKGGIEPDVLVEPNKIDAWRIEEMLKLRDSEAPRDYVEKRWAEYKERFTQLAENDRKDTSQYPGFDEWYRSLGTPLSPDDVRQLVRAEIRRRVQDARGQEFPQGDFVEDPQLQEAIRQLLGKLGAKIEDYDDYRTTIQPDVRPRLALASGKRDEVLEALEQLRRAQKSGGRVSPETIEKLVEVLDSSLKAEDK